ncbi:MAG: hypothetical protein JWQ03_3004, partial [Variovorax sp.]|nr:hypothetical protein [Variovorax sp.]
PVEAGALLAATIPGRLVRQSGDSASRGPTPPAIEAPAPLMPRADTRPAARSTPPFPPQGAARPRAAAGLTADDGNTEVHIHIGRIDVTAAHDAPPARRRSAAAAPPAPMSLDGYLAARQRGRP